MSQLTEANEALAAKQYNKAENLYNIIAFDSDSKNIQDKEQSVLNLAKIYVNKNSPEELYQLVGKARELFSKSSKAKVGKVLKDLISEFSSFKTINEDVLAFEKKSINESITWSINEKKSFLRQSLQLKLATAYYNEKNYTESIKIINALLKEFKKLDDKSSLIEVQLLESKIYFELKNFAKAKASLTSAKTSANSVYTSSKIQAELDLMSGILHCEDGDYETAYSYFYEAFESFNNSNDFVHSIQLLKYMILTKIMMDRPSDIQQLLSNKSIVNNIIKHEDYKSSEFEPMKLISKSYENKSLNEFQQILIKYNNELSSDSLIKSHFKILYNNLLEQNLLKIIKPYSIVEVSFISNQIKLDSQLIENKLSQMILDGGFYGVLDQGNGWLYIYDEPKKDPNYDHGLSLIQEMNTAVDLLYEKASSLN